MKLLQPRRFNALKAAWVAAVLLGFYLYTTHRDRGPQLWSWTGPAFGATYSVNVFAPGLNEQVCTTLRYEVESCLDGINRQMSTWLTNSDISAFNASTSTAPMEVAPDLTDVVSAALDLSRLSGGAFDSTFLPMFRLWGFGKSGPKRIPSEDEIARTLPSCGHRHLSVPSRGQLQKDEPTLQFDLNAIAPGYAADRVMALLLARGLTNLYVDVGGEVIVHGLSPRGDRWRVGIEKPEYDEPVGQTPYEIVHVPPGWALATSGDYRSYVKGENGRVYSHIFDPRVGRPATSQVASVSILYTNCMGADGLATTLYVMGPTEGLPWLSNVAPAEALFIMRDTTGGFFEVASAGFDQRAVP